MLACFGAYLPFRALLDDQLPAFAPVWESVNERFVGVKKGWGERWEWRMYEE